MSFLRACAHWDAFGHEQPERFDVASWMRARGVSDVGWEVENHHNVHKLCTKVTSGN
jgi:hypothetical protein